MPQLDKVFQDKRLVPLTFLSIFLFWFLLSKDNYFHWDEWEYLLNFNNLPYYIFHQTHEQFAFLQIFHHYILFKIFGLVYWPFQLTTSLFHAFNSLILYFVVTELTKNRKIALLAMVIFGFSSVSVENINNSAAVSQDIAGLLCFSAFLLLVKFLKVQRFLLLLMSAIFLVLSPMGHGITLLEPFAFASYVSFQSVSRKIKTISIAVYLISGSVILLVALYFGQRRLYANVHFNLRYFLVDIPYFVIAGVLRGNIVRFLLPELYVFNPKTPGSNYYIRDTLRIILRLALGVLLITVSIYLLQMRQKLHKFWSPISKLLIGFFPLVVIGYIAAAPSRAYSGFNQAIITRYTYESFFFLIVLASTLIILIPRKFFSKQSFLFGISYSKIFLVLLIYILSIHLFADWNFQTRYWRPIVDKERYFIADVNYLFTHNNIIYDLPAKGIWPTITLSKLWFLLPENHQLVFLKPSTFPKDLRLLSDERSRQIYRRLITDYNVKTY